MIHDSRDVFEERLKPESFHTMITGAMDARRALLLAISTGAGKTHNLRKYIVSGLWRQIFGVVVIALYTRDQIDEVAAELREEGVSVGVYPDIESAPCMPNNLVRDLVKQGQDLVLQRTECRHCSHKKTCRYIRRTKAATYAGYDVIIIPEQVLGLVPNIVQRLAKPRRPLLVLDEVVSANARFLTTITAKDVEDDRLVAESLGLASLAAYLSDLGNVPFPEDVAFGKAFFTMSVKGPHIVSGYRCHLREASNYARAAVRWHEGDVYAYQQLPVLPTGTIFMGAYLSPALLAFLFDIPEPLNPFAGEIVVHPQTRIYNLQTTAMAKGKRWQSLERICNLIADLYVQQRALGKRLVVLGSKGEIERQPPAELVAGLNHALERRGKVGVRVVHWQADNLRPDDIVFLTYGATGSNRLKDCHVLVVANAFYVTPQIVQGILFGHLKPSERPKVHIRKDRTCTVGNGADAGLNRLANLLLFRLEADVMLQGVGRIRQAVEPRLVIMSSWYNLEPQIGPSCVLTTFEDVRDAFGLPDTRTAVRDVKLLRAVTLARQGGTLPAIATAIGVSRSWLAAALAAAGIHLQRGRPLKTPPAASASSQ